MIKSILVAGETPAIGTGNLESSATAATAASVVIQTYVTTILAQPPLSLPDVLPELPNHQKTARDNAKSWRDNVQPSMIETNTDIVDFANAFTSYYDPLLQLAVKINNNPKDREAIATFKQGLIQLKDRVNEKAQNTEKIVNSLSQFQTKLAEDARNFGSDLGKAEASLAGTHGQIEKLKNIIAAQNTQIGIDIAIIAGGSVAIVAGGVAIVVGIFAEIPSAGATIALIVGGLALVATGTGAVTAAAVDIVNQSKDLGTIISEEKGLEQQYASTKFIQENVQMLHEQVENAVIAVGKILTSWQVLDQDFVEFLAALDKASPNLGHFLLAQLAAAKKDWEDLEEVARKLLSYGSVPERSGKVTELGRMDPFDAIAALAV